MYFKLSLIGLLLLMSCKRPYELFVEDFKEDISKEAREKCEKAEENRDNDKTGCDVKRCLSSPITLLAMQDLLVSTDAALKNAGIPYVLDGGTHLGQQRFEAHLPWDDDSDLNVMAADFSKEKRRKLKDELRADGLEFAPLHTINAAIGRRGMYQVAYNKGRYFKLVKKYKKDISDADLKNLWKRYDAQGRMLPHLDISVWDEVSPGKATYQAEMFARMLKYGPIDKSILFPFDKNDKIDLGKQPSVYILGKPFSGMNNFFAFSKNYFGPGQEIITDFVINPEHKLNCPKIRLKDIHIKHPEYLKFFKDYLKFVFKDDNIVLHPDFKKGI